MNTSTTTSDTSQAEQREQHWFTLFLPSLAPLFKKGYGLTGLRNDIFGGLTAAVVALPLALAFGVASGAGAFAGLYGAIAVGFFAAMFGGTPAQVAGPTGPMTVVMGAVIATHAQNLPEAFTIVMLGGIFQIGFGLLRVGRYVGYTPYSVVSGFMTGIGVIIMIIETLPFVGLPTSSGGVIGTLQVWSHFDPATLNWRVLAFALVALGVIVIWPRRWQRVAPAPLAILVVGTFVATFILPGMPSIGDVPTGLPSVITPVISLASLPTIVQTGFVLALLGSIDSLLTSLVADSLTRTQHDSDKELVGQGLGNLVAGLIGAIPGAGATMRTVINIRAGGRTPLSGMLHAAVLFSLALGLGPLVSHVPHAVLAAILMKVGWDIIDWGYLKRMKRAPRAKVFVMLVTFALTVFVDLITAVAVGIIIASFVNARSMAREQLKDLKQSAEPDELDLLTQEERAHLRAARGRVLYTLLHGRYSYASARELARRVSPKMLGHKVVIYDFTNVGYIDTSAAMSIDEIFALAQGNGQQIVTVGIIGPVFKTLDGLDVLRRVPVAHRFDNRLAAIDAAVALVEEQEAA